MKWQELVDTHGWTCAVSSDFYKLFHNKFVEFRLIRDPSVLYRGQILETIRDYENWHIIFAKVQLVEGDTLFINPVSISEIQIVDKPAFLTGDNSIDVCGKLHLESSYNQLTTSQADRDYKDPPFHIPSEVYSIGYGGRSNKEEFIDLMKDNKIRSIVDVRLRPDRASMGMWCKAKNSDRGIEKWLSEAGLGYYSLIELGNIFLDPEFKDWRERYQKFLVSCGDLLIERLVGIPYPWCILCAEKKVEDCHRLQITNYLRTRYGVQVHHL